MLCENLIATTIEELDLTVKVRVTNLDAPRSEEELRDELLAHALDCYDCLTVVLFRTESLADCGCATYKRMYGEAMMELKRQAAVDASTHLTEEILDAFFLDRLSDTQLTVVAEHVEGCSECTELVRQRQTFYLCVKAAMQDQKEGRNDTGLSGVIGVNVPEQALHLCSRLNQ